MHLKSRFHWWIAYSAHFKLESFYPLKYFLCIFLYPYGPPGSGMNVIRDTSFHSPSSCRRAAPAPKDRLTSHYQLVSHGEDGSRDRRSLPRTPPGPGKVAPGRRGRSSAVQIHPAGPSR